MLQPADIAWKFYVSFRNRNRIFAGWRRRIDVRGAKESQQEAKISHKAKASQKRRSCSLILLRKTMRSWIALMGVPCDLVHLWISIKGKIYINQKYFYAKKYHQYRIHQDTQMKQSHDQQCESNRCNMQLASVAISWKKPSKAGFTSYQIFGAFMKNVHTLKTHKYKNTSRDNNTTNRAGYEKQTRKSTTAALGNSMQDH